MSPLLFLFFNLWQGIPWKPICNLWKVIRLRMMGNSLNQQRMMSIDQNILKIIKMGSNKAENDVKEITANWDHKYEQVKSLSYSHTNNVYKYLQRMIWILIAQTKFFLRKISHKMRSPFFNSFLSHMRSHFLIHTRWSLHLAVFASTLPISSMYLMQSWNFKQ